jgi:uncharacterized protein (DUF2235 family)
VFYDQGVGTGNLWDRWLGGAFGAGLEKNVVDAYRFIMHNYEEGDRLFLFGFSRGAYTARSTVGLLRNSGLLKKAHADHMREAWALYRSDVHPNDEAARGFRAEYASEVDVHFLGVWDTVGARGIPVRGLRWFTMRKYRFHDVQLSGIVKNAYHAAAIDERRSPFRPSLWEPVRKEGQHVEQVWFTGVHSDVGGGYAEPGLCDAALLWMTDKARDCGLVCDDDYLGRVTRPDAMDVRHNSKVGLYRLTRGYTRPMCDGTGATVHPDVMFRRENHAPPYRPTNLESCVQASSVIEAYVRRRHPYDEVG